MFALRVTYRIIFHIRIQTVECLTNGTFHLKCDIFKLNKRRKKKKRKTVLFVQLGLYWELQNLSKLFQIKKKTRKQIFDYNKLFCVKPKFIKCIAAATNGGHTVVFIILV